MLLNLSSSVLFIPLLYNAFEVFQCNPVTDLWLTSGWQCKTGLHAAVLVLAVVMSLAFLCVVCACKPVNVHRFCHDMQRNMYAL